MARTIVMTSGKGGVGKTTLTANLGRSLARQNLKVVLLDADLGLNNLDVLMDVENKVVYDIIDVIENRCRVKQALIEDKSVRGLFVLPSAHSYDNSIVSGQNIKAVINILSKSFDYILVDSPAGIEAGFHRAVQACDEAIVVTTPHISAIRDADKVITLLKSYHIDNISVVINRARGDLILSAEMFGYIDIQNLLKTTVIGVVPDDDAINLLSNLGLMIDKKSEGWDALDILASNLHTGNGQIFDVTKKYKGMWGGLKRNLRRIV